MSYPSDFDTKIDVLDILINALRDHEEALRDITERFEAILGKIPVRSEGSSPQDRLEERRWTLEAGRDRKGVLFISGDKIMLIPEEELPQALHSKRVKMVEYEIDTPEKRSALEKLFSMLKKKEK